MLTQLGRIDMTSPLRLSLLGLGRAGQFHLQSLRLVDEAILDRVFDIDRQRAARTAAHVGCQVAESAEAAICDPAIDAVLVATPTDAHFESVRMALGARKAVLTEKPLGRRLNEIDECFELAAANAVPLFVAFQRRFDPSFSSLIDGVRKGQIGRLQFVRTVSRDNPVPSADYIRISGGIFHDCLVHDLDMVCHLVGEVPARMAAFASSFIPEIGALGDFDSVAAMLSFESGVTASIDVNRKSVYGYDQRVEAFGDQGMLQAENRNQTTLVQASKSGFARSPIDNSFPTRYRDAYREELRCFVECARGSHPVPITHQDVRVNHLLASGLEIAAREQRVVGFHEIESLSADVPR